MPACSAGAAWALGLLLAVARTHRAAALRPCGPGQERHLTEEDRMSELREQVRDRYAAAAKAVEDGYAANDWDQEAGCCEPGKGLGHELYDSTQRSELPDEAVLASLGCGNPHDGRRPSRGRDGARSRLGRRDRRPALGAAGRPDRQGLRARHDRRDARHSHARTPRRPAPRTSSSSRATSRTSRSRTPPSMS